LLERENNSKCSKTLLRIIRISWQSLSSDI
jgi:hypothetical protein